MIYTTDPDQLERLALAAEAEGLPKTATTYRIALGEAQSGRRMGIDAGRQRWRRITDNPYRYDTIGHANWQKGFTIGRDEMIARR